MLNRTSFNIGDVTNQVSFNAPSSGIIQRSHPRSNFVRFHARSKIADWVFSDYPRLVEQEWKFSNVGYNKIYANKIVVLQVMVFGDDELLVEYVNETDLINNEKTDEENICK